VKFHFCLLSKCSGDCISLVAFSLAAVVAALFCFAHAALAQSDGHSYLRLEISGHPMTNVVLDEKYQGWLAIEGVRATIIQSPPRTTDEVGSKDEGPGDAAQKTKKANDHWLSLPVILRSGHAHAGKIRFGAGDSGGLEPLLDAQKRKTLLASANLDLYDESNGTLPGKYQLKGIRVLSLEDVQASACAMYEVTMSFQSARKVQP
jgi:hypothetical protein